MKNTQWKRLAWVNSIHTSVLSVAPITTAKRLHITAQGCRAAATLGEVRKGLRNPNESVGKKS